MLFAQLRQPLRLIMLPLFLSGLLIASNVHAADILTSNSKLFVYENSSGGKFTDVVKLTPPSIPAGSCAEFVSAKVEYKIQRFGDVIILSAPEKGCNPARQQCKATVSSRIAPVGRVHFIVRSSWEVKSSGC
ncbi:MAG: hypothetical protein R3F02_06370 [Thiolinea sp.]